MRAFLMASAASACLCLVLPGSALADCAGDLQALQSAPAGGAAAAATTGSTSSASSTASGGSTTGAAAGGSASGGTASAGQGQTAAGTAGAAPGTQGTQAMSAAVGQTAASPQDVVAQQAGQPTAAEASAGSAATGAQGSATQPAASADAGATAPGQEGAAAAGSDAGAEIAVLVKRGQAYAEMGNDAACMNILEQARGLTPYRHLVPAAEGDPIGFMLQPRCGRSGSCRGRAYSPRRRVPKTGPDRPSQQRKKFSRTRHKARTEQVRPRG